MDVLYVLKVDNAEAGGLFGAVFFCFYLGAGTFLSFNMELGSCFVFDMELFHFTLDFNKELGFVVLNTDI